MSQAQGCPHTSGKCAHGCCDSPVWAIGASHCDLSRFRPGAWRESGLLAAARLYKSVCFWGTWTGGSQVALHFWNSFHTKKESFVFNIVGYKITKHLKLTTRVWLELYCTCFCVLSLSVSSMPPQVFHRRPGWDGVWPRQIIYIAAIGGETQRLCWVINCWHDSNQVLFIERVFECAPPLPRAAKYDRLWHKNLVSIDVAIFYGRCLALLSVVLYHLARRRVIQIH